MTHSHTKAPEKNDDPRRMQLLVGLGILGILILIIPSFYIIWHYVPGVFGEFLGVVAGVLSTPFLLEISFAILGLIIVVAINNIRMRRNGDEYVTLEETEIPTGKHTASQQNPSAPE